MNYLLGKLKRETELVSSDLGEDGMDIPKLTLDDFKNASFPWEISSEGNGLWHVLKLLYLFSLAASFKEDFRLIDTWMLMKRNKEQPLQSLKEFSQLLQSLKKNHTAATERCWRNCPQRRCIILDRGNAEHQIATNWAT